MKKIVAKTELVAYCGLYCGACQAYLKGRCPGCHENEKASWCAIRSCCLEHQYQSCVDCSDFSDPMDCKKYNNLISKIFGVIFNSDRAACIQQIRDQGLEKHAQIMAESKRQSMKKKQRFSI